MSYEQYRNNFYYRDIIEFLDNKLRVANYTMLDNYIGSCVIWAIIYALTLRHIKDIKPVTSKLIPS